MTENMNHRRDREKKDLFDYRIAVEEPIHVTVPKSFHGGVWISLRVTELMVVPVCTHPINGIPLQENRESAEKSTRKKAPVWNSFQKLFLVFDSNKMRQCLVQKTVSTTLFVF